MSALGFGCMRLPITGGDEGNVDEAEGIRIIRYAIDHGVNYVDTGNRYHGGKSEIVVGKALKDGYREKVKLSTKPATGPIKSLQELDEIFEKQLTKLQVDHVDIYMLGGLGESDDRSWSKVKRLHLLDWAEKKMAEGKFHYFGFSYHGRYDSFKEIVDGYDGWTFCQIIYNYLEAEMGGRSPGSRALQYAAEKGLAVVAMEPIQGGNLATRSPVRPGESPIQPGEIQTLLDQAGIKRKPADFALQWVWNHPEVSIALSGMNTMNQVLENIESASHSLDRLAESELKLISKIREIGRSRLQQT
ncbi:MAG: aldo/keto reductase [Candidatus Bathyarchaeota archaeon]